MTRSAVLLLLVLPVAGVASAGPAEKAYRDGELEEAKRLYEERLAEEPADLRARYNLGNVQYRAEDLQAAEEAYRATLGSDDLRLRGDAAHNLGNVRLLSGDLDGAIQAYQDALRARPGSADSRYNLELALRMKEMMPMQPQQQQGQQDQGEEQKQEEQDPAQQQQSGQQNQQERQGQEEQQKEQQQQEQEGGEEQPRQQPSPDEHQQEEPQPQPSETEAPDDESMQPIPPPAPEDYTEQDAERVLDGLSEEERELIADRMRARGRNLQVEKDW